MTYDGTVGAVVVKGTFSMTVDYDRRILVVSDHVHLPVSGSYTATVLPDSSNLVVVGIK